MKFTISLFLLLFAFSIQAQIIINPVQSDANFVNSDLTDNALDLEAHISVTNDSSETINIVWTRIVPEDCPEEWDTQVCDNNLCYFFPISSNVDPDVGLDAPFVLNAGETFDGFIFHVLPRSVPGCCKIKIEFATVENPDVIIETAVFDVNVNTTCDLSTSTEEFAEAKLVTVYPNPVEDSFTLTNNDVVKQIDLYNTFGQKLKTFDFENGEYYNVADLNPGMYSLVLKNEEGKTMHTLMLDRI